MEQEDDLLLRMERNLAEHACHLHRQTPGMRVRQTSDILIADSGLDDDTFNIVAAARFTPDAATARIQQISRELAATGRRFCWWVGAASTPADLAARLARAGRPATAHEAAMWVPLAAVPWQDRPAGLDIRPVTTADQLADYATVLAASWNPPALTVRRYYARTASQALARGCPASYLVGYHQGQPVCAAEMFRQAGVAGIYNVCTLATHRQRGYGTAVVLAALRTAHQQGLASAVLQAAELAEPLYRRIGFDVRGRFSEHPLIP